MRNLLNYACLFLLAINLMLLSACGGKNREVAINTPGSDGNDPNNPNKPKPAIPPQFDVGQLKVGNFIEWSKITSAGTTACQKWTISEISTALTVIKRHKSNDCKTYSDDFFELIYIRLEDGLALSHFYFLHGERVLPPPEESFSKNNFNLYKFFYKNPNKVLFTIGSISLGNKFKYPVFALTEGNWIYYNDALDTVHPWHAVILRFTEDSELYTYKSAKPELVKINP